MRSQERQRVRSAGRPRTLAQVVVEDFSAKMAAGVYKPGDQLPTEPELTAAYGVSRTVVREAISRLQATGLAESRHGVGTFVLAAPPSSAARRDRTTVLTIRDVLAFLEYRSAVEMEAAALAAARRSKAQLATIQRAAAQLEKAVGQGGDSIQRDYDFHLAIAAASGNKYVVDALARFDTSAIPRTRLDTALLAAEPLGAYLQRINQEHRAIVEAIARKDSEGARAAIRLHLTNSIERLRRASGIGAR